MSDDVKRLTWTEKTYSGWRGHLTTDRAKLVVASVDWDVVRRGDALPWKLRMDLPGFSSERAFATSDEAKACAERILVRFIAILTESRADEVQR